MNAENHIFSFLMDISVLFLSERHTRLTLSVLCERFHSNSASGMNLLGNNGSGIHYKSTGFKDSSAAFSSRRKALAIFFFVYIQIRYFNNMLLTFGRNFNLCKMKERRKIVL